MLIIKLLITWLVALWLNSFNWFYNSRLSVWSLITNRFSLVCLIPVEMEIQIAVSTLSPVNIHTFIPAFRIFSKEAFISSYSLSSTPVIHRNSMFFSSFSITFYMYFILFWYFFDFFFPLYQTLNRYLVFLIPFLKLLLSQIFLSNNQGPQTLSGQLFTLVHNEPFLIFCNFILHYHVGSFQVEKHFVGFQMADQDSHSFWFRSEREIS